MGSLYGYGIGNEAAHLGTFCVKRTNGALPSGDYEVVTQYYNANNNGFGFIVAQDMAKAGINRYNQPSGAGVGWLPAQVGSYNLTPGVKKGDYKSPVGKFTTPACGGPDKLYLTYDPGWGNHKNDAHPYHPEIVFTDLEPAHPSTVGAYLPVIRSLDSHWGAVWAKPLIDWTYRLTGAPHPRGKAKKARPPSVIDPNTPIPAGHPFAMVGTASLINTDIKPIDCKDSQGYYNPYKAGNTIDQILNNIDSLTRVIVDAPGDINAQTGSCAKPTRDDVFGIAIYLTSNKINDDQNSSWAQGYTTDGRFGNTKETKRLLGVFEIGMDGQTDTSFKAIVPANVPIDFHLLDRNGLKLADVRSWHSLKPRETRADCGGCHNHRAGEGMSWDSSDSADPNVTPHDMVRTTPAITYDASCQPMRQTHDAPVQNVPAWQDLSAPFQQYCGGCHADNGPSATPASLDALSYDPNLLNDLSDGSPLYTMRKKKYIDRYSANASRLFWAARGARTDGRDNDKLAYQPSPADYSDYTEDNPKRCGYKFSDVHASLGLCDGSDPDAAHWVYQLGQWIDNHAVADTGKPYGYHDDRFHPTVDGALEGGADCLHPQSFNVGYWDDSGGLASLSIDINGQVWRTETDLTNGVYAVPLGGVDISGLVPTRVKVTATDAAGNTQRYEKSVRELILECVASGGILLRPDRSQG